MINYLKRYISNMIFFDIAQRNPKAIRVFELLIAGSDNENKIHISETKLAKLINVSSSSVKKYIHFLYINEYIDKLGYKKTVGFIVNPAISWNNTSSIRNKIYKSYRLYDANELLTHLPNNIVHIFSNITNYHESSKNTSLKTKRIMAHNKLGRFIPNNH